MELNLPVREQLMACKNLDPDYRVAQTPDVETSGYEKQAL